MITYYTVKVTMEVVSSNTKEEAIDKLTNVLVRQFWGVDKLEISIIERKKAEE